MQPTNRRDFLKHASATAAVVGVAAAAPLSIVEKAAADDDEDTVGPRRARASIDTSSRTCATCRPARSRSTAAIARSP